MMKDEMSAQDVFTLDRMLTTYSMEEIASVIEELCHGVNNAETKRLIELLQKEVKEREAGR